MGVPNYFCQFYTLKESKFKGLCMTKLINKLNLLAVAVSAMMSNYVFATTQVIHAGELLSIPGKNTLKQQTVVVQDGKILLVKKGYLSAKNFGEDATLIDLSNSFVMPGLMDMHVHLQMEFGVKVLGA